MHPTDAPRRQFRRVLPANVRVGKRVFPHPSQRVMLAVGRVAAVVVSYGGSSQGFVLAGRSLREAEVRESQMLQFAQLAGIIILVVTFIAVACGEYVLGEGKG